MLRLRIGRPMESAVLDHPEWIRIPTLTQQRLLSSLGVGVASALSAALAWSLYNEDSLPLGSPSWTAFAIVLLALSLGHEGLHLLGFPRAGFDGFGVIGIWPEAGSPYVQYLSPMTRARFLLATLLPFLILTVLPFSLVSLFPDSVAYLSWISVLNGFGAGSDILIATILWSTVPHGALVVESGEMLYWRRP